MVACANHNAWAPTLGGRVHHGAGMTELRGGVDKLDCWFWSCFGASTRINVLEVALAHVQVPLFMAPRPHRPSCRAAFLCSPSGRCQRLASPSSWTQAPAALSSTPAVGLTQASGLPDCPTVGPLANHFSYWWPAAFSGQCPQSSALPAPELGDLDWACGFLL